eukprot:TRINITY_DN321_c0_g1_i12.p1 TRINITY_DN321_c0_g1~~TRINITY_DN321_c0_g1_i12.p1  ORF type:complete len:537 (+),score=106.57 TRINITY_DN321_c0_g1_i12:1-1611(+)
MSYSVGKEAFSKYANDVIQAMISIQTNSVEGNDPLKSYLISGWQRLCLLLEKDILPYMRLIMPSLFKMVQDVLNASSKAPQETEQHLTNEEVAEKKFKENVNTSATEDAELAVRMLCVFIDELGTSYSEFVESTVELLVPIVDFNTNDTIRKIVASCLPKLLRCTANSLQSGTAMQIIYNLARAFNGVLWNAIATEFEPEVIIDQIEALREILSIAGRFLTGEEVQEYCNKIIVVLQESDNRKSENESYKHQEDVEEEEIKVLERDNEKEDELHDSVADLLGALFASHQELTLPFVEFLYTNILSKTLGNNQASNQHINFSLQIISDMIEYLGIKHLPDKWVALTEALIKYAVYSQAVIRQPAVYALGVLAEKNPEEFQAIADHVIQTLRQAIQIPIHSQDEKIEYGNAQDNSVAALGKIVKALGDKVNFQEILQFWLKYLPLRYDKEEAIHQHQFLTEIVMQRPELVLGASGENLPKVLSIFGDIVDTKISNAQIKQNIQTVLAQFMSNDSTKALTLNAVQHLSEIQKAKLQKLI